MNQFNNLESRIVVFSLRYQKIEQEYKLRLKKCQKS
ncbi:unnamed protein product [Paramecium primaurelia]|uniref:Uncharacterized protein n=1 Tax=Paramecium primaurelia TaxID=5886 RepID=A0A8S1NT80_PARPR|nr:unnamed protein product [Paramecium primaurelia]